jgi:hypothetical protein
MNERHVECSYFGSRRIARGLGFIWWPTMMAWFRRRKVVDDSAARRTQANLMNACDKIVRLECALSIAYMSVWRIQKGLEKGTATIPGSLAHSEVRRAVEHMENSRLIDCVAIREGR